MFSRWRSLVRHTLGVRLALWYALFFTIGSVFVVGLTYFLLAVSLQQRDREIVRARLVTYADEYERGGLQALNNLFRREQTAGVEEPLFVRVVAGGQQAIIVNLPPDWGPPDLRRLEVPEARGDPLWGSLLGRDASRVLEVASLRLADDTLIQVGKSTESRDQLLRRFRTVLLGVLATIIVLGVVGSSLLTRSSLAPLRRLTTAVEQMVRTGQIEARLPIRATSDPLDRLAILLNLMLDRIAMLVRGMHDSLDNVAHDLRTPMARLRVRLESALQSADGRLGAPEQLADCLDDVDRVLAMLDTLMDIAEAEAGTMRLHREPADLGVLVAEATDLYADVAEEQHVTIATDVPSDLSITVDRTRIRQVLANLLDNAIKYTPEAGEVRVTATEEPGSVRIAVSDTGVGIAADELPRIWDRLYRGDHSRSERGLGLGLSLVRAVVEAHGGQVTAASTPGTGTTITLHLPT